MKRILMGLLALSTCSVCGCRKAMQDRGGASEAAETFLGALAAGKADQTYDTMVAAQYRQVTSRERHAAMVKLCQEKLGDLQDCSQESWHVNYGTQGTIASFRFDVTWTKDRGTVTMRMRKEDRKWKVLFWNVQADALVGLEVEEPAQSGRGGD